MPTKVLITGGRAPAALDLARQLHANGYIPYVADSEVCAISRRSNVFEANFVVTKPNRQPEQFIADILRICQTNGISTIIPTCEETFHLAKAMDQFERNGIRLFTSPIQTLRILHNKYTFIDLAKQLGLPTPTTYLAEEVIQVEQARTAIAGRCVLKPAFSRFSESVFFVDPSEKLPAIRISTKQPWVVQQCVSGTQYCTYSIAHAGKLTAHGSYATRYAYGHATVYFESSAHEGIQAFVEKVVGHLGFTGQISFDFIVQEDGVFYPIECNPRTTSGVHLFYANADFPHTFFTQGVSVVTPTSGAPRMLGLAMLRNVGRNSGAWRAFLRGRDVIWSSADPRPAWDQYLIFIQLMMRAWRHKKPLTALLTEDIQWDGE